LAENIVENYDDLAYDLGSIYQVKSYDQLREILMANLQTIVQETPEALIPGWDDFSDAPTIKVEAQDDAPAAAPKTAAAPKATKVNIKLADDEQEAAEATEAPTKTVKSSKKAASAPQASESDEDIFALADSILQN
jgi:hypothetical protein